MEIKFVGSLIHENDVTHNSASSVAGNKMQMGIIKGLYRINKKISVISAIPNKMFNGKGKLLQHRSKGYLYEDVEVKYISYINFIFLKQLTYFFSYLFNILSWCVKSREKEKVLLVYNPISYIAWPAIIIGRIFKCKTVCIIADLSLHNNSDLLRLLEDKIEIYLIKRFDKLIPITKNIAKDYSKGQPYLVIEGGVSECNVMSEKVDNKNSTKKIVFTGSLNELSGIKLLLDALINLNRNDVYLHIYGRGSEESIVNEYMKYNGNIIFHGYVDNKEILEIQKHADILVSPRLPDDYATKYTFPSKLFEYMMSGVPVICNQLSGIPKDYGKYINIISPNITEWVSTINQVLDDKNETYRKRAFEAAKHVAENKNWYFQSSLIYEFIINKSFNEEV